MCSLRPAPGVSTTRSSIRTAGCSCARPTNTPIRAPWCESIARGESSLTVAPAAFHLTTSRPRMLRPMTPRRRNRNFGRCLGRCWPVLVWLVFLNLCRAETVTLHLRNGDRVTGEMVSLDTACVILTNSLLGKIVVPVAQVERLEKKKAESPAARPATPPATNTPPTAAATNLAPALNAAATNNAKPSAAQPAPVNPKPPKHWVLDAQLGADLQYNQTKRQLFYGRAKWTYGKNRFRSIVDFLGNYGKNDGVLAANDVNGRGRVELAV